ncbi:hypothetical protein TRFO_25340 [Tritrichomonas foetus]|uniref:Uncharacterized protein n=1 Tax=Tritrichomonas foetus TaxID=1144522 RepID=A0A1J4K6J9_9EUKA|nr:hypothetical protein TRFO_25340 [Tritrichomonas foetus]|eukprot:OHT06594.1 hypothetical protein TRFO_25340 [Tritrichomonas foetus]
MTEEVTQETLEELSTFLTDLIGPDKNAIQRFLGKEGDKFELIKLRLNELIVLLEEVVTSRQFGDPNELNIHLKTIFSSIDAICSYVYDIKQRLLALEKEVDRRKPNKLIGFFKNMSRTDQQPPLDLDTILFDTDKLLEKYGIVFSENGKEKTTEK